MYNTGNCLRSDKEQMFKLYYFPVIQISEEIQIPSFCANFMAVRTKFNIKAKFKGIVLTIFSIQ